MMRSGQEKRYLTPTEVAEALLVSPVTVRQWAQKGWIEARTTAGGHRRFLMRDVEHFARDRGLTLVPPSAETLRVLIVDADEISAHAMGRTLSEADASAEIEYARDGFDAGAKVRSLLPQVMILDLDMTDIDGIEVCRRIKGEPTTRSVEIVTLGSTSGLDARVQATRAGAKACLAKPVDAASLLRAVGIDAS